MAYLGVTDYNLELFLVIILSRNYILLPNQITKIYNAPEDMRTYTHQPGHGIHYESLRSHILLNQQLHKDSVTRS